MPETAVRFQFIDQNEISAGRKDETKSLRLVRAHVMREIRRKQKAAKRPTLAAGGRAFSDSDIHCQHDTRPSTDRTSSCTDRASSGRSTPSLSESGLASPPARDAQSSAAKFGMAMGERLVGSCLGYQQTPLMTSRDVPISGVPIPPNYTEGWLGSSDEKTASIGVEAYRSTLADSYALAGASVDVGTAPFFHHYLHHFISVSCNSIYPVDPADINGVCASTAMSSGEPALMNAICFTGALHQIVCQMNSLDMSAVKPQSIEQKSLQNAMKHKAKTLAEMNKALSDNKQAISNASLVCVSLLRGLEGVTGDRDAITAHTYGLKRMVELRGGLDNIDDLLAADILTSDTKVCLIDLSQPSFPLSPSWQERYRQLSATEFIPHSPSLTYLGYRFFDPDIASILDPEMLQILHYFRHLINYVEQTASKEKQLPNDTYTSGEFLTAESLLLSFPYEGHSILNMNGRIQECCRIAVLLYSNSALWNIPSYFALKQGLVRNFRNALKELDLEDCQACFPDLLLWLLFLGSWASEQQLERTWYVHRLARVVQNLGLVTWEDTRLQLQGFFYVDRLLNKPWGRLFDEVKLLGEDL